MIVTNYRGIKNAELEFGKINVLIGKSDSTKSTILKALQLVTSQSIQPNVTINDYYKGDSSNEIKIEILIKDFPEEFLLEEKYGLYLLDEYPDEPVLKVTFIANSDFETNIMITKEGFADKVLSYKMRKMISVILIESNYDKNFFYGKYSMLNNLVELGDLQQDLKKIINDQDFSISNENFSKIASSISEIAKKYAVYGMNCIETKLDKSLISTSAGSLGLFSNDVLLSMKGFSDKKMLSIGLALEQNSGRNPIMIDEIENSLEPYKIRFLTTQLNNYSSDNNTQIFITTHSPFCVGQSEVENIKIIRNESGVTTMTKIPNSLRCVIYDKASEAIFAKKIIAVEGKTELGYINALNDFYISNNSSLAYYGTSIVRFDGDMVVANAIKLLSLGFPVLLVVDNDVKKEREKMEEFVEKGGKLITYKEGYDIEMACFEDLSIEDIDECFKTLDNYDDFCLKVNSVFCTNNKNIFEIFNANKDTFIAKICRSDKTAKLFKNYRFGKSLFNFINGKSEGYMKEKNAEIEDWIKNEL